MTDSAPSSSPGPAKFVPPSIADLNTRLPQFEFIELLGAGGMGAVYKARQPKLNRFVAIKVLPKMEDDALGFSQRFEREAQSMAQLSHPHIASVYDFGETEDGQLYFVMEFIEGADLHRLIHGAQLTSRHFFSWVPQICAALEYAHDHGVVHRDIKPANILINAEGQVRVVDFGLAKLTTGDPGEPSESTLTHHSLSMGTPDYAAPEQIESSRTIDGRADIYSLGVVMYQMLTGRVPRGAFRNPSLEVPGIDKRLDDVVLRAMQAAPSDRFQRPSEISSRLHEIQSSKDGTSGGASSGAPKFILPAARKAKPRKLATGESSKPSQSSAPSTLPAQSTAAETAATVSKGRKVAIAIAVAAVTALIAIATIFSDERSSKVAADSATTKQPPARPTAHPGKIQDKNPANARPEARSTDHLPKLPRPTPPPLLADTSPRPEQKGNDKPPKSNIDPPGVTRPAPAKSAPSAGQKGRASEQKGPDRRRRMFGERDHYERRSHKNLTLISRSEQPLDDYPLTEIPAELGIVTHLVVGQSGGGPNHQLPFAIARDTDGKLHTWGTNQHGELDIPDVVRSLSTSGELTALSAGSSHVLALDNSGKVYAWGSNERGQASLPADLLPVTQIAAHRDTSVALLNDGTVRVWGGNPALAPPDNLNAVKKIALGDRAILALHLDGTITGWGSDAEIADNAPRTGKILDIACVGNQNFALMDDGQLLGWGDRPAKRPLPKLNATAIQSARDILAVQLRSGGWVFFEKDPRSTPTSTPINRRQLNATASANVIFSWVYNDQNHGENSVADLSNDPVTVPLPAAAQTAIDEVQQRLEELYLERVETPYRESLTNLNRYYLQYLEADAGVAQNTAQLDTLVAIKAEQENMQNGGAVPSEDEDDTPVALANRRNIYRHTLQNYEEIRITAEAELNQMYIDKLELMKDDFTRQGDTASALAIRDFRDRFAATHITPAVEAEPTNTPPP